MKINAKKITAPADLSLKQQRLILRQQMTSQRLIIDSQLGPLQTENTGLYPRSNTMRFLTQRPELIKKLLGLLIGASFIKSMHPLLTIVKFLHSGSKKH